jgi:hypothetical protein
VATWHDSATGCIQAKGTLGRVESGCILVLEPPVFSLVSYSCLRLRFVHEAVFPLASCAKRCFRLCFVHAAVWPLFFLFMLAAWPLSFSFLLDCAKRCVRYIHTYTYVYRKIYCQSLIGYCLTRSLQTYHVCCCHVGCRPTGRMYETYKQTY